MTHSRSAPSSTAAAGMCAWELARRCVVCASPKPAADKWPRFCALALCFQEGMAVDTPPMPGSFEGEPCDTIARCLLDSTAACGSGGSRREAITRCSDVLSKLLRGCKCATGGAGSRISGGAVQAAGLSAFVRNCCCMDVLQTHFARTSYRKQRSGACREHQHTAQTLLQWPSAHREFQNQYTELE